MSPALRAYVAGGTLHIRGHPEHPQPWPAPCYFAVVGAAGAEAADAGDGGVEYLLAWGPGSGQMRGMQT